jgi:hypothetical protein
MQEGEKNRKYLGSFLLLGTLQNIAMDAIAVPCWKQPDT